MLAYTCMSDINMFMCGAFLNIQLQFQYKTTHEETLNGLIVSVLKQNYVIKQVET